MKLNIDLGKQVDGEEMRRTSNQKWELERGIYIKGK